MIWIVIPVYNTEKLLPRLFESLKKQIFSDFEIVCINDGSKDKSLDVLNYYSKIFNNFKIINQTNKGSSAARNVGIEYVLNNYKKDDLITFIDSDDYVDNDYLVTLHSQLVENDVDIVASNYKTTTGAIAKIEKNELLNNFEATKEILIDKKVNSHSPHKLYKVELWKNICFPQELTLFEDVATIYKIFYKSKNVFLSSYSGYNYCLDNSNSISHRQHDYLSAIKAYFSILNFSFSDFDLTQKNELKKIIDSHIARTLLFYSYRINYKKLTKEEKAELNEYFKYAKRNKVIKLIEGHFFRKLVFSISPKLYRFLFNIKYKLKN